MSTYATSLQREFKAIDRVEGFYAAVHIPPEPREPGPCPNSNQDCHPPRSRQFTPRYWKDPHWPGTLLLALTETAKAIISTVVTCCEVLLLIPLLAGLQHCRYSAYLLRSDCRELASTLRNTVSA